MERIKSFMAAIARNARLCLTLALVGITSFASYQHGKYVGQLGGKYDSAAYEAIMTKAANNVQVADSGSIQMPPTIDEMNTKEQEEARNYRRGR